MVIAMPAAIASDQQHAGVQDVVGHGVEQDQHRAGAGHQADAERQRALLTRSSRPRRAW